MRNKIRLLVILTAGTVASPIALPQDDPTRPVRLVVPFTPGGSTDILARLVA